MSGSPFRSNKIHPSQKSETEEEQGDQLQALVSIRAKPNRGRMSTDFSLENQTISQKYRNAITTSSFLSTGSSNQVNNSVEVLINFLTVNTDFNIDPGALKKFEELASDVLASNRDPELVRIVKNHGWTGSRFRATDDCALDAPSILQSFSNWYLKHKFSSYTAHISNLFGLGDAKGADQILSFCPDTLLQFLKTHPPKKNDDVSVYDSEIRCLSFTGACMLADISGFSKFSGAMCSKGVSGLDDLREATNGFLGHFVKTVYENHGDVIAFAGDALICVFVDSKIRTAGEDVSELKEASADDADPDMDPADDFAYASGTSLSQKNSANCCYRALQCACILKKHHNENLSTHLGVSYGEMKLALLGGLNDQWTYLMNGQCVSELASCINDAGPQEVAATPICYDKALSAIERMNMAEARDHFVTRSIEGSRNILIENMELLRENGKLTTLGRKMSTMVARQSSRCISVEGDVLDQQGLIHAAAAFVPNPILTAVYSESLDHIGELRQVTTMFLELNSYSPVTHCDPTSLQPFFLLAQGILHESGGFLRQFLVDDKGCVFIAMWGMPSFTYANNCSRALFCAVSICMKAKEQLGFNCSAGITTGNIYCGSVGAPERRDYAGIGNEVNMAARLMAKAKGRVLLDTNTYGNLNATTRELLILAEEMKLKGAELPVRPYQYNSSTIPRVAAVDEQPGYSTILRRQVKAILGIQIDKITNINTSTSNLPKSVYFTLILGLPGTGKSTAAEYFRHGARKRNIPCIYIQARPGHEGVPYGLMRELFLELVGSDNFYTEEQQRQEVTYLIDQAYADSEEEDKAKARLSLELLLGVEWSEILQNRTFLATANNHEHRRSSIVEAYNETIGPLSGRVPNEFDNIAHASNEAFTGMYYDSNLTLCRKAGDLTFYKVMGVLLRDNPQTAIIIEDAHFCDELSWNELHLMLLGNTLNLSIVITMRSNTNAKAGQYALASGVEGVPGSGVRQSLLVSRGGAITGGEAAAAAQSFSMNSNNPNTVSSAGNDPDPASKYGLKFQTSPAYLSIVGHENTTVIEMSSLTEAEVRDILCHTLKVNSVSNDIVRLVLDVSSGNAYWCKSIASFIKERGIKELEEAVADKKQNALKVLILLRMEKLSVDHQLVLKHASIIGDEFSEKMLHQVLPAKLQDILPVSLELLAEHGFILCIEEFPDLIFGFQNQLIRQTLSDLMPPSDAAGIHFAVAKFIESEYAKNLRPFYPILANHYKASHGQRQLAFKYKVKAADQAISRGAFNDGLAFVQEAATLAVSKPELKVMVDVISRALRDLAPVNTGKLTHAVRRLSRQFNSSQEFDQNSRIAAYLQLKLSLEAQLEKLVGPKPLDKGGPGGPRNPALINKQPSARLNWQPSYVASKQDEDDDEEEERRKKQQKGWGCLVS